MTNLEQQMKSSYAAEDNQNQMPSEPAQEMPEPAQEVSDNVSQYTSADASQESYSTSTQSEAEAPQETTRKKKRGLF